MRDHANSHAGNTPTLGVAVAVLAVWAVLGRDLAEREGWAAGDPRQTSKSKQQALAPAREVGKGWVAGEQQWLRERPWRPQWSGVGREPSNTGSPAAWAGLARVRAAPQGRGFLGGAQV